MITIKTFRDFEEFQSQILRTFRRIEKKNPKIFRTFREIEYIKNKILKKKDEANDEFPHPQRND